MGDKATSAASPGSAKPSRAARGDAAKRKEVTKRGGRSKKQPMSESEEEEEEEDDEEDDEEEEEEADEEDEEEEEEADASETGSDSERESPQTRKKLATRKPSPRVARKAKDDDKRKAPAVKGEKPSPPASSGPANASRRRQSASRANKDATESDDGSETTSQATDDEMTGRASKGADKAASANAANSSASTASKDPGSATRDREREGDRVRSDREPRDREPERAREREREPSDWHRDAERDTDRERNSSMTLPSLSRAAMMHMNRGRESTGGSDARAPKRGDEDVPMNGYGAEPSGRSAGWRRDRSRSRSRERGDSRDANRWNDSNQPKDNGRADEPPNYAGGGGRGGGGGGGPREDEPMSPGQEGQDVRIMFHGREVYADDLIGLRVAKTFVGHGRFLGQVVKFDEPTSLYTIVYADGDAEELSIENTIQILIQDEIERADPSVPPVSAAFRNDRIPDSPEAGSVTPSSTATVSVPVAPMNPPVAVPPPSQPQQQQAPPPQQQPPVFQSRRSSVAFTDREAQFLRGMFENNALPVLLRQGWRVQSAGSEQRFFAPPGNFRGAGHVFLSAFDVVELIVFDSELLAACFPQNMHSVILSLYPETASAAPSAPASNSASAARKRVSPAISNDVDSYDAKRVRNRESSYGAGAPMGRGPVGGHAMGLPPGRSDERLVPPVSYRPDDRERDGGYGAPPSRMAPPLASGDRFPPGSGQVRGEPSDGYRRASGDYRSMPLRPMAPTDGPAASSRWGGGPPPGGASADANEYHHRRAYGDAPPEWHDRDPMAGRGGPPPPSSSSASGGYMGGRPSSGGNHRGSDEPSRGGGVYYSGDRGLPRGGPPMGRPGAGPGPAEPVSSYGRYRGPAPSGGGQYSPGADSFSSRYPPSGRSEPTGPDYRGPSPGGGPPPQQQQGGFARNGGGRGFSMMDVDRNVSGSSGYDHRMERGRSPHLGADVGGGPAPGGSYMAPPSAHYGHHQRTGSNGVSGSNPADDSRTL